MTHSVDWDVDPPPVNQPGWLKVGHTESDKKSMKKFCMIAFMYIPANTTKKITLAVYIEDPTRVII